MASAAPNKSVRKAFLTPNQLTELKKGPRANVVVGPDGNRYIGLEGASVNLLAYFSPTSQKMLVEERGTVLTIPNGNKQAICWVYKYLQSGEKDPQGLDAFEALTTKALVLVYETCAFLEYEPLQKRIEGRLRGTFYNALPTVDKIKVYQTLIPSLYKYAVRCLCKEMVHPWACSYISYYELAETNQTFGKDLGDGLRKLIDERIKSGEEYYQRTKDLHVIWAIKYVNGVLSGVNKKSARKPAQSAKETEGEAPSLFNKSKTNGEVAPGPEDVQATSIQPQPKSKAEGEEPICYGCNETGHIRRHCPFEQSHKTNNGEGLQTSSKPVRKSKARVPFLCYNCGGEGHMSRDCTVEVAEEIVEFVGASTTVKDTTGRNNHLRRVQHDRKIGYKIDTYKFGGGITTCDCEVKRGEKIRTGLTI